MYPLLSKGRWALLCLLLATLCYFVLEPLLLRLIVQYSSFLGSLPARTAILRAAQLGPMASSIVVEGLTCQDPLVQILSCRILGESGYKLAVIELAYLVRGGKGMVSEEASLALEKMTGRYYSSHDLSLNAFEKAKRLVENATHSDAVKSGYTRRQIIELGLPASRALVKLLEDNLSSFNDSLLIWIVRRLKDIGHGYEASDLLPLLESRNAALRRASTEALIELGRKVVPALLPLLEFQNPWNFDSSVQVMEVLEPDLAARRITTCYLSDASTSKAEKLAYLRALGVLASPEGFEALRVGLEFEVDTRLRLAALRSIAQIEDPKVVNVLLRAVQDSERSVRRAAIQSLYSRKTIRSHNALADTYLSKDLGEEEVLLLEELLGSSKISSPDVEVER